MMMQWPTFKSFHYSSISSRECFARNIKKNFQKIRCDDFIFPAAYNVPYWFWLLSPFLPWISFNQLIIHFYYQNLYASNGSLLKFYYMQHNYYWRFVQLIWYLTSGRICINSFLGTFLLTASLSYPNLRYDNIEHNLFCCHPSLLSTILFLSFHNVIMIIIIIHFHRIDW